MKIFLSSLFLGLIISVPAFTQIIQEPEQVMLEDRIYESAWLSIQVDEAITVLEGLLEQLSPDNDSRAIVEVLSAAYDSERMRDVSINYLERVMNEGFANQVLLTLEDENFYQIHKAVFNTDLDLENPEVALDFEAYIESADTLENSAERIETIQDIIRQTRVIPTSLQRLEDILTAVMFGINIALPEVEQVPGEEINELIITLRANFRQLYDNVTPAFILYATRDLTLEDLKTYRHFLTTPAGSWYIRVINRASLDSFEAMSEGASRLVAEWAIERAEPESN